MEDMNFTVATIERQVRENDRLTYEAKEKELVPSSNRKSAGSSPSTKRR